MLLGFTLGTLSAIGGFIDIGDLVTDAQVGARFGLRLAWITVVAVIGIACFSEMAARVAISTRRPAFSLMRSRLGPRYALGGLVGSMGVTVLLVMAELSGVALALQIATSIHYLAWVPVAAVLVAVLVWVISFEHMEQTYGLLGLAMLVYVVAVWQLGPDWGQMLHSASTVAPTAGETWPVYAFYAVALVGAQMTPYEMYFFSSGAIESRWTRKDLIEMRVNVVLGFPLGGLLAIAIQAAAYLVFFAPGVQVEHLTQTVLPVAVALGKTGLVIAIIGVFAATFGATLETLFATGYDIAQYFGWSYGEVQPPVRAARFTVTTMLILLAATAFALTAVNPITVTIFAVVCSAVLLPFAFLPVLLVANDREVMGDLVNGRLSNILGTATLLFSVVIAVIAIPLLVWTRAGS
jgi:Mn2+/Fe2+ NRAMP family transporter